MKNEFEKCDIFPLSPLWKTLAKSEITTTHHP